MVAQTRRKASEASKRASLSPATASAAKAPTPKGKQGPSKSAAPSRSSAAKVERSKAETSADKPQASESSVPASSLHHGDVSTIPLYDFDLPLELDTPYGSKVSAFNPAPYESLRQTLQQWFPDLCRKAEEQDQASFDRANSTLKQEESSSDASYDNMPRRPARGKALTIKASTAPSKATAPYPRTKEGQHHTNNANSKSRKGKTKSPDCIHLEVEFVPQLIINNDLFLPRDAAGRTFSSDSVKRLQAYAVVALAPPDYVPVKPAQSKTKQRVKTEAVFSAGFCFLSGNDDDQGDKDEDEDDLDTLLLGYIVPSCFKDTAHPLAHMDPSLVSKEWIQLYGEVTLAPPFLPPGTEVLGPDAFEQRTGRSASTVIDPPKSKWELDNEERIVAAQRGMMQRREIPSTRLLGVLSVQVGLEPAALQYGLGSSAVDGFVASNDDLKDSGAEGSLGLARALRFAIPAIVDWPHSFIEIDMHAHTYWDRNASYYDLPPKQSTLARHLVLDKIDSVDLPSPSKSSNKKRKKASSGPRRTYSIYGNEEQRECSCPHCNNDYARPEPVRLKPNALSLGAQISGLDPKLGDPTSDRLLPLDTNIASLLEACRPPPDGPMVHPPADIIPTPLLGYQARCVAWMIKRETVLDEEVGHLMPNWFPLRSKDASLITRKRLQLEAERLVLVDAMQRGLSRSRRNVNVKAAQAAASSAGTANDQANTVKSEDADTGIGEGIAMLKREPFIDPVHVTFYFDHVSGMLSLRRFTCRPSEPGGALCEAMGLGKTIESLSLIAAHPRPDHADLLSYDMSRSARMVADMDPSERPFISRATLVVCPAALVEQWMDEIRKHFRSRITTSTAISRGEAIDSDDDPEQQPGVVRYRHADFAWDIESLRDDVRAMAKERLTQPEIIVATYEELAFQLAESKRVPRTGTQVRTPLLEVLFWRILLDEAQLVAGASGKATEMVHELWRSNCWMVTGTPVTKGIRDIQGIFAFLDHDPFAAPRFFRGILQDPFTQGCVEGIRRLRSILPRFVWRHTQAHVEEEITLPPCNSEVLEIDLKHVEKLFYDKEVNKYRETYAKRAVQGAATVPQPTFLVSLRQLLSHPQIAEQLMFSNNYSRLSFAELFRQFCQQAQSELDNIRMQLVTSALQLVWGHDFYDAEVDKRKWRGGRRVLQDSDEICKVLNAALRITNIALDDQQRAQVSSAESVQQGRDETEAEAGTDTDEVMPDDLGQQDDSNFNLGTVANTNAGASSSRSPANNEDEQAWGGTDSASRVNLTWEEAHYWLRQLLQKHSVSASDQQENSSSAEIELPARWDPERPSRTFFEKEFKNAYDKTVDLKDPRFHLVVQDASVEDMDEDELMTQIEAERKSKGSSEPSKKKQRKDTAQQPGLLKKSRLRGNASQRKISRVWLYKPKERLERIHTKLAQQQSNLPSKEHEVAFLRQKLVEVQASEAQQTGDPNDPANTSADSSIQAPPAECQICYDTKEQIGVLPCYHSFCIDCIETICKNSSHGPSNVWTDYHRPRCPSCRLKFHPGRVTRVMERGRSMSSEGDSEVIGDWSGKISGLISDLKKRLRADATHKAVIFSHWPTMLAFVRDALVQNDISAVVFGGNEAAQAEALRAIRDDDDVNVILVPFRASAGAAGLTLTSCDLAYLLEPALDAALEAQAIGRILRIGQRRVTAIIRVKMKDTIEDAVMRIADERSRRGMALAAHANPARETTVTGTDNEVASTSTATASALASTSQPDNVGSGQAEASTTARVKIEDSANMQSKASTSNLRERSIKSSVAASVGAARDSDNTSLTMAEVALILGFDIEEEKRKSQQRRASLAQRVNWWGGQTPAWVNRLTEEELDVVERDLAFEEQFDDGGFDDGDDDDDMMDDMDDMEGMENLDDLLTPGEISVS
ncbi:related to SNF2 family helicase/ATPase [Ustilago sp. UG-2017b]|nr:related to SNF2 family helicase/ATPase [Ustilago sp. UG-2017b]